MTARTIKEALEGASFWLRQAGIEQPRSEAEILLARLMNIDRLQLFLRRDEQLSPGIAALFQDAVERRCRQEPAAYITGEKHFYGHRFAVNRDVLIPRPETELLVESALEGANWLAGRLGRDTVCVDLGTGSGVIAVTLALLLPRADIWAVDHSKAALKVAGLNAAEHGVREKIHWLQGNYFEALDRLEPKPQFNLVVSNPPYLSSAELASLPRGVKDYEPVEALDGGADGLDGYRHILDRLEQYTAPPALLLLEVGANRSEEVEALCVQSGHFSSITWRYDLGGWPRVLEGAVGGRACSSNGR